MHELDLLDSPLYARDCILAASGGAAQDTLSPPSAYLFAEYNLKHHHIQLALKYHRLGGYRGLYAPRLRRLLATYLYIPELRFAEFPNFGFHAFGVGKYSYEPRVAHGRFLLSTKLGISGVRTGHEPTTARRPSACATTRNGSRPSCED